MVVSMNPTSLDLMIVAVVLISAALSLLRGFTREVLSITGWIVSGYAAIFIGPALQPLLGEYLKPDWAATGAALGLVFVTSMVICSIAGAYAADQLKGTSLGPLDRSLGIAFGGLRGAFIVCMAYLGVSAVIPEDDHPDFIAEARLRPILQTGSKLVVAAVPLDRLPLNIANIGQTVAAKGGSALQEAGEEALKEVAREELENLIEETQDSVTDTGYKQSERDQIERLIRNTEGVQ